MKINFNLGNILLIILVVLSTIMVVSFFKRSKEPQTVQPIIDAYEKALEAEQSKTEIYRQWKDDLIAIQYRLDSTLQSQEKTVITKYEKVPVIVHNLDKEQLRSAISKF